MKERVAFTVEIVKDAGENIRRMMNEQVEVETKANPSDFVTNVDKETEIYLVKRIKERYENQDFLTEENTTARASSSQLWIIDPIDGTTNFIFQKKNFAISVAYYENEIPQFGIVYDVMADKLFLGVSGEGATLNGVKMAHNTVPHTLSTSILYGDLFSLSMFPNGTEALRKDCVAHRYLGAASLEVCLVAENLAQSYISRNLKVWDIAAAVIILRETGGSFFFGGYDNGIYYNDKDGVFLSAQNQEIILDLKERITADLINEKQ